MKILTRMIMALLIVAAALTWTACTTDGYGSSTVYVGVGYGGYGPGWGYGWGGYYAPPPVVIGPPMGARPMPY